MKTVYIWVRHRCHGLLLCALLLSGCPEDAKKLSDVGVDTTTDVASDGNVDTGTSDTGSNTTYACGSAGLRCRTGEEFCQEFHSGVPAVDAGIQVTYTCEDSPNSCSDSIACSCITPLPGGPETTCRDVASGQVLVTVYGI